MGLDWVLEEIKISYTGFVPKVSVLIFYLNVYWTRLKLQIISFKVDPWEVTQWFQRFFH